ncbi:hypothetical protein EWM64_g7951 [Hericium alpestre]|uniref:Protein kinase domain-containing protein n=1 Tax=Hericium alpestre TaxID=135208 RepID=A0A4Y9ZP77_9AGAM|nr:hypothetical protein EWM64_g7951 [Hericium alpestre]
MDAIHVASSRRVCLKRIALPAEQSVELQIIQFLSSEQRQKDPRNHAVPLLDVLRAHDHCFLILPLCRSLFPPIELFNTLGEGLDFVDQTLEGFAYLHEVGIAHRDCAISNMVMDADKMLPHSFHPDFLTKDMRARRLRGVRSRTHVAGVKYYFIDFGESMKFDSTENVRIDVWSKASIHAPETLDDDRPPYDPFKVDIWAAGTTYANVLVKVRHFRTVQLLF